MKNTFHVAHFHINVVLLIRNMFKQAHVINKHGRSGTGVPLAPVLLFELYLAMFQTGGKPSTWFPPVGLVELYESRESFPGKIKFQNSKISKFSRGKSQKITPVKKLESDGNFICIITRCSYSAKMKLQYMKNIFQVAHFHIMIVSIIKNILKQVHVINKLGRSGTGVPLAPVLCFKPAVNRQPGFRRWDS